MPVRVVAIPRKTSQVISKDPRVRAVVTAAAATGPAILAPSRVPTAGAARTVVVVPPQSAGIDIVGGFARLLEGLDYFSIGGVMMGVAMVLIGLSRAAESKRAQQLEIAGDIAPALIGAATGNPLAGAAAQVGIQEARGKARSSDYRRLVNTAAKSRRKKKGG